jgi:hypothetical protein
MTTQAKHSAGPWEFDGRKIVSPERYVATVDDWSSGEDVAPQYAHINEALHHEAAANARLIASAPEMLEALRAMVSRAPFIDQSVTEDGLANCEALLKARRAISHAEGEQ